jgi:hypothetical protein
MIRKFIHDHQILIVGIILGLGIWLMYFRRSGPPPPDTTAIIAAKDETIRVIQESRDRERSMYDETIARLQKDDSLLQFKDKVSIIKYATIPVYIAALGRDSLRAEVLRFSK